MRHAPPNPYGKLFDTASLVKTAHERENKDQPAQRSLVCGMTLVPGDPNIDPQIYVTRKSGDLEYTLRKVAPPVCKPN